MAGLVLLLLLSGDLDAAERALAEGRPRQALELLGDLADRPDADVRAHLVQGRAYLALGEWSAAVEPLARASDARPGDEALARDAAGACFKSAEAAAAALRQGEARLYLEDARRFAERGADEAMLADVEYALGDYEAALARYRALPEGVHARIRVADCLRALDRTDEARAAYGEALEAALAAGDLPAAYRAAFAAQRSGRFLAWLDEQIGARPDNVTARLYRGYVRTEAAMYAEAAEDFRFVIAKSPGHAAAKDRLSLVLLQHGVRQQATALLDESAALAREVLDADPAQRGAWDRLVWVASYWWQNGDIERLYAVVKDLHARDPADVPAALNFGMAARRLGRYEEAQAAYERVLEVSPRDPDTLVDYGILRDALGDREGARDLWEQALAEDPNNLDALENLFTDAWERGVEARVEHYLQRGLAAARERQESVDRWLWFRDRLLWAQAGFRE